MKILEIRLHGFKSFSEKTSIKFEDNLIGIVGPNGSGKSNIIDAVKWVFGEQKSKTLRTKTNTDVIFVGTDTKKAMNFAEVSIVFDNQDHYLNIEYTEVVVTRRLYRTGENEYFLNKNKCRLKDINDLVLDKGFGKNSFSIISQGKVEEIIMAKPETRREIVEEVAGVLKYKNKKDIATKKLTHIQENLDKITLITSEIEQQIAPLKEASQKAEIYQKLNKDFKTKDIAVMVFESNLAREELEHQKMKIDNYQKLEYKFDKEIKELQNKEQDQQIKISSLEEQEQRVKGQLLTYQEELLTKKNQMELMQERSLMYQENGQQKQRIQFLTVKVRDLEMSIETTTKQLANIQPQVLEFEQKTNKIQNNVEQYNYQLRNNHNELLKLEENNSRNRPPYAVEKILKAKINGVIDIVDNLYTTESETNLAINTILGMRKNEIVCEDQEVANRCIEMLKKEKSGRVTIIPLNKIKPRFISSNDSKIIEDSDLFLGVAIDFIETNNKYQKVFASLLGTTIICKNSADAYLGMKKLSGRYMIVTLEGDIISNNGKITGGFDRKFNKFNVSEKLKELKITQSELTAKRDENQIVLEQVLSQKKELEIEYTAQQNFTANQKKELETFRNELKQLQKNSDTIVVTEEFEGEVSKLQDLVEEQQKTLATVKIKIETLKTQKEELMSEQTKIRADEKVNDQQLNENKIKIIQFENQISLNVDRLREEYQLSFEGAQREAIHNIQVGAVKAELKVIKEQIRKLGFVNLDAPEQYLKQKERLDYYQNNAEDLVGSRDKVKEVMLKLDTFVIERFEDAYTKLNKEFGLIYQQLFDGGIAELVLTNPDDLLTTGVEIIARPPGKKSQIIGLLSGGEKALTAIALLFAILKVRVIPFAILDEVEAALDEVNVDRYASYLQVFSQKTQFLVITHRSGTMEKVDRLYGVTMPQRGISKILDIDLKEQNV